LAHALRLLVVLVQEVFSRPAWLPRRVLVQTYTKPKKIKHKHKNVKLRVLKYYKVEDSGKVTRTRKQCPSDTCGAGIFMATHKDRVHCGKCNLTFIHTDK
jgi:ubiquitin-small subunit ribosomal protein S27Ae